ncbi:unnamed protein product, partial [marine sediment metagenome]
MHMSVRDNGHLAEFEKALEDWVDERFVSRDMLRALTMFSVYLVNLSEADGWQFDGYSYKTGIPMGCLTVKATIDGVPQVVFTSGRTHTGCVVVFMRKLDLGLLEWR